MKKILLFLIGLSVIAACAMPVQAGEFKVYSANGYKQMAKLRGPSHISINGEAVMLLVDFSGSMGRWITEAKETLEYILPRIPYKSAVALRVFGERAEAGSDRAAACTSSRLVTSLRKGNQSQISEGLSGANLGGLTPLVYGLQKTVEEDLKNVRAFDKNTTRKKKKIILVTDGGETCGGDPCVYIREVMQKRKDIKIDVIQLGNSDKLACLADATGGTFHKIDGSRQKFENAFEAAFNVPVGTVSESRNEEKVSSKESKLRVRTYNEKIVKPRRTKKCLNNQPLASNYKFVNYGDN